MLFMYAVPAVLQSFVRPNLEKYFISNADVTLISACNSMGELLVIVISAVFCTKKTGEWFSIRYFTSYYSFLLLYKFQ